MQIAKITPTRAVDNAFLQESIAKKDFEQFRGRLLRLLNHANDAVQHGESEEHLKGLIKPFLNNTSFGEAYYINTKERQDLAIHNGKTGSSTVGVILEAKRPSNKEMITAGDVNRKAFHEAILYYLREHIENGNEDIKHIVITDVYRWFVFDAQDFKRYFYDSKKLRGWFDEWNQGRKVSSKTKFIYNHLSEFIGAIEADIKVIQFDIREFQPLLQKDKLERDEQKKLVPLFKFFTPTHLLKLPFASDSNNLNRGFYQELLYIMGLQEYKEKGTHFITRLDEGDRHPASLIENTITQLKSLSVLSQISNRSEYGDTEEEQLFNVAIQLLITWINRILFLKLLEAQLYKYHREEDDLFRFLSHRQIEEYDDLNKLFFQVLAVPDDDRSKRIAKDYGHIPYLNSSLFDVANIEREAVRISELEDGLEMQVYSRSKIRNKSGERLKGEAISALEYLLRFLDAYSFNSEGTAEVQEEAKTLINASVLGRIFEKINGYKDGSFFTPGFITEYMCRETIRRAVVQKFSEAFEDWDCEDMDDLRALLSRHEVPYEKANAIVNSTTICDPAVGSGHFLVSALNELISIKHDLRIFVDEKNERFRDVDISVDNDELRISVGSNPFFEYRVQHQWKETGEIKRTVGSDTQRLQKALFREKNILIENCLFGVDINPNSVSICRLRLWVELLKHAYYREDTGYRHLEVLPNIDINIKQGNSLVSRFGLDVDLSSVFKDSDYSVDDYKEAVRNYKQTRDRTEKRRLQTYIDDVKEEFSTTLMNNRPINKKLSKARGTLEVMNNADLFGNTKFTKKQVKVQEKEVKQLEEIKAEEESGVFYNQAFEWRFEFPEVLDEEGSYTGFDVVIGNPPYISHDSIDEETKEYLRKEYKIFEAFSDVYCYFLENGISIAGENKFLSFITSNSFLRSDYGKPLRELIYKENIIIELLNFDNTQVFGDATVVSCILTLQNGESKNLKAKIVNTEFSKEEEFETYINKSSYHYSQNEFDNTTWSLSRPEILRIINKINAFPTLEDLDTKIRLGLATGANYAYILDQNKADELINTDSENKDIIKPILRGRDIKKYSYVFENRYILLTKNGINVKEDYTSVYNYLNGFGEKFKNRGAKGQNWTNLRACSFFDDFKKEKICWIELSDEPRFILSKEEIYLLNTAYFMLPPDEVSNKYLLGILNSKINHFFLKNLANTSGVGTLRMINAYVKQVPVPIKKEKLADKIEAQVDQILTTKQDSPEADTSELEAEIDQLVYELYGLSEEEIEIVEESVQ